VPPKVEYSLTPLGESLKPVLAAMHEWGVKHLYAQNGGRNHKRAAKRSVRKTPIR
jgi:DNA-binding HxlR family transcriptional regulator